MSKLMRLDAAEAAASVGSFVVNHAPVRFTPWASGEHGPEATDHDEDDAPMSIDQATADAFAQGFEEGRRVADLELADERDALRTALESVPAMMPQSSNVLAAKLAVTVERLVRDICGMVDIDQDLLLERARGAAQIVIDNSDRPRLRVNAQDAEFLAHAGLAIEIFADPDLPRGNIKLETAHGWIEDGPDVRLRRLHDALDRLGMPQ